MNESFRTRLFWCSLLGLLFPVVWFVGVWKSVPTLRAAPHSPAQKSAFGVAIAGTVFATLTLLTMIINFSTIRSNTFGSATQWGGATGNFYVLIFLLPVMMLFWLVLVILTALFVAFSNAVFLNAIGAPAGSDEPVNVRGRTLGWSVAALVFPALTWVAVPITLAALGKPAFKAARLLGVRVLGVASFVAQILVIVVAAVVGTARETSEVVSVEEDVRCGDPGGDPGTATTCGAFTHTFVFTESRPAADHLGWLIALFVAVWLLLHIAFTLLSDSVVRRAIAANPVQALQATARALCPSCQNAIDFVPAPSGVTRVSCSRCKAEVEFETKAVA